MIPNRITAINRRRHQTTETIILSLLTIAVPFVPLEITVEKKFRFRARLFKYTMLGMLLYLLPKKEDF